MELTLKEAIEDAGALVSHLTLSSMKANYPEFVDIYGFEGADAAMGRLYKATWDKYKELIWQWYDWEYSDDEPS
jgi:hypothetical protein